MTCTVVLATRNRASSVRLTLQQLANQARATGARLVVVDNASRDDTMATLAHLAESMPLTFVREPEPGKNRALNRALPLAEGDLVLFTDDDVEFAPDWIEQFLRAAERWPDAGVFGGRIDPVYPCELPAHLSGHDFLRIAYAGFSFDIAEGPVSGVSPFGPNFAVRRHVIGTERFDERFGQVPGDMSSVPLGDESEFLRRMRARSGDMVYVPSAWVRHRVEPHQLTEAWLFDRSFRFGRGLALGQPDRSAVRLGGVPRYLWRLLAEAQLRSWRAVLAGSALQRFDAGLRLHLVRGQIYQYRRSGDLAG